MLARSSLARCAHGLAVLGLVLAVGGCGALGSDAEAGDLGAVEPGRSSTSPSSSPSSTPSPTGSPSGSLGAARPVSIGIVNIDKSGSATDGQGYTQVRIYDEGCEATPGPWRDLDPQSRTTAGGSDSDACFDIRLYSSTEGGQLMRYMFSNVMLQRPFVTLQVFDLPAGRSEARGNPDEERSLQLSGGECRRLGGDTPGWWVKRTGDNQYENFYVLVNGVGADEDTCPT